MTVEYRSERITVARIRCDWPHCSRHFEYRDTLYQTPPFRSAIRRQMRATGWGTIHRRGDILGPYLQSDLCKEHLEESRGQLTIEGAIDHVD